MKPSYDYVYDEYEDGTIAARDDGRYVVRTPDGQEIEFGGRSDSSNRQRVRQFAALFVQLNGVPMFDDRFAVPVSVALAGKPAIASYLFAVHGSRFEQRYRYQKGRYDLANILNVQPDTILKYYRRTLENAKDKRIGGHGL